MLSKAYEFVRIADANPSDEKVRRRKDAAALLLKELSGNRDLLLSALQGVVAGFDKAHLTQDSALVQAVLKAVKGPDTAFPEDLSENAMELRSVAGIAVGELLTQQAASPGANGSPVLAALCLRSAFALRGAEKNQHLRAMFEALEAAAQSLSVKAAQLRRQRNITASQALQELVTTEEEPETERTLEDVLPIIGSAFQELRANNVKDREELEVLWWLFSEYSETADKLLRDLSPAAAAFCAGLELADRSLLPPSHSTIAMVDRAVKAGHGSSGEKLKLEEAIKAWTKPMVDALLTPGAQVKGNPESYPALIPLSWACQKSSVDGAVAELDKNFTKVTGIDKKREAAPAEWGAQIFREKIVLRLLARKES